MSKAAAQATQATVQGGTRSNASVLQRQSTLGPHVCVQREAAADQDVRPRAPSLVRQVIDSPGRPLDAATRSRMEPRFGYDFSQVRIHSDNRASESARAVNANAYTAGHHVAFGEGKYAPGTSGGQRLLAHELTHVVQQASGPVAGKEIGGGLHLSHPSDRFERKAAAEGANVDRDPDLPGSRANAIPLPARKQPGTTYVQRDSLGLSTGAPDEGKGSVNQAAALSSFAAVGSAVGGLVSAFAAIRAANFAGRSAEAAEDPPTAEPTGGGVAFTDADIPEVKGLDLTKEDQDPDVTETIEDGTEDEGKATESTEGKGAKAKKITTKEQTKSHKESRSKVIKSPDKPDQLDTWHVLNVNQGPADSADFYVSVRSSGKDIKDGGTLPPESTGFLGGSSHSNVSVNFRARPGAHDPITGAASVGLGIGGTNTPPRKFLQSSGVFGGGGPVNNDKYNVQRFGGVITFYAPGEKKKADADKKPDAEKKPEEKKPAEVDKSKKPDIDARLLKNPTNGTAKQGDGKGEALVTIHMDRSTNPTKGGLFHKDDDPTSPQ